MLISRGEMLAIVAVVDIAIHGQDRPVRGSDIGPRHGLGARYLETALRCLAGSGILTGTRGTSGGYQLARLPSLITVDDILRALRATQGVALDGVESSIATHTVIPALHDAQMALSRSLQRITVQDLADRAVSGGQA